MKKKRWIKCKSSRNKNVSKKRENKTHIDSVLRLFNRDVYCYMAKLPSKLIVSNGHEPSIPWIMAESTRCIQDSLFRNEECITRETNAHSNYFHSPNIRPDNRCVTYALNIVAVSHIVIILTKTYRVWTTQWAICSRCG